MNIPTPYSGNESYIFISYSHRDTEQVFPIITELIANGYRVWFDGGIDPGTEWDENIAHHIEKCGYFFAFISKNYLASSNCKDELNYARDLEKERLIVYLEQVELPGGMAMRLNRIQSIFKYTYGSEADFYKKLFTANNIELCYGASPAAENPPKRETPPIAEEPPKRETPPVYTPPKQEAPTVHTTPKQETPPTKAPENKQKPKVATKLYSIVMVIISTIILVASFGMGLGDALFPVLGVNIVLNIIAQPGLKNLGLKILSQLVFWISGFGFIMALELSLWMSEINPIPIMIIVGIILILLYYKPKWLMKIFKK